MRTKLTTLVALALFALSSLPARANGGPAEFEVGFGVRTINPVKPQPLGGFGYDGDSPTNKVHDPMQVRAIAIKQGSNLVEMAIVDTQGYFAGNQEGPWGSYDARVAVAAQLAGEHLNVGTQNIIVSSTHSHAAPTIMGIWGIVDPDYLKTVYEGTVGALLDAAHSLQPATLYAAEADISDSIVWGVSQTDGYQGWLPDGKTPVLWARHPFTGATLGVYANIPVHADVVNGADNNEMSADHIGVERTLLEQALGGTAVVAMGTLGRQESIIQVKNYPHADALGRYVTNEILRALGDARPITDPTVAAAEQYLLIPATNPALIGLDAANMVQPTCVASAICTIDRSLLPPFAVGDNIGTWFTALRIGDLVYATEPGEAFPEVSTGIRAAFGAPDRVRIVGMAQDQLGYYYPPESYPFTVVNDSDHHIYNSSLALGEVDVNAHALNALALGFSPTPVHETNQWNDMSMSQSAGVQFFPARREGTDTTFTFDGRWSGAAIGGAGTNGPITWNFGDGSATVTSGQYFTSHTFPSPGIYTVTASIPEGAKWSSTVIVNEPLQLEIGDDGNGRTSVLGTGGAQPLLAAHWAFDDETQIEGFVPGDISGHHGTVTAIDSAGNVASVSF